MALLPFQWAVDGLSLSPLIVIMSDEKLVKDLSYEAHFLIYKLLLPPAPGRDWKTLADKMGYTQETILYYECLNNPVKELISDYESKGKPISELLTFLEEMERIDLVTDLEKYVGKAKEENSFMNQLKHFEFSDLIRYTICLTRYIWWSNYGAPHETTDFISVFIS